MPGKNSSGNKSKRTRNWVVVVYPDSAPDNWREYLDSLMIEWIESPLHEFDTESTGEVKKAHWHVLLMFGGMKTYDQVVEVVEPLNCTVPQRCLSVKGTVRYMAHLDNPDKHQYLPSEIVGHGGVDLADFLRPSASQRYDLINDMCDYVKDNGIVEFQDLMDFARREHREDWLPLLCDNSAYVMGQYIKSQRHRQQGR